MSQNKYTDATRAAKALAVEAGVDWSDITGKRRFPWLVAARAYVARGLRGQGLTPGTIGMVINRDRTSVLNLLGK